MARFRKYRNSLNWEILRLGSLEIKNLIHGTDKWGNLENLNFLRRVGKQFIDWELENDVIWKAAIRKLR